jgi:hypothetical protein
MPRLEEQIVSAHTELIKHLMYDKHLPNRDIIRVLREEYDIDMPLPTFYNYKQRIQQDEAELWDKVGFDSAKYRAVRLLDILEKGQQVNERIMADSNASPKDISEASKNAAVFATSIYRLVKDGPDFKQLPLVKRLTNTNTNLNKDKPTQTTTTNDVITTNRVDNTTNDDTTNHNDTS